MHLQSIVGDNLLVVSILALMTNREHIEEHGETLLQLIQSSGIHSINFSILMHPLLC